MAAPPFAPVGRCIYCGATRYREGDERRLGDEHIIPFSLGGTLILPQASCQRHEKITSDFEYTVGRRIFGNFRLRHNIQSKREKERPTHITVPPLPSRGLPAKLVPIKDYPTVLFLYKFHPATILADMPADFDVTDTHFEPVAYRGPKEEMIEFEKKYGVFRFRVRVDPLPFARMLAKIGHSLAVAVHGFGSFIPLALDLILGKTDNFAYTVGGSFKLPGKEILAHTMALSYEFKPGRARIFVKIRLFPYLDTPFYYVVVGEAYDEERIRAIREQSLHTETVELALGYGKQRPSVV